MPVYYFFVLKTSSTASDVIEVFFKWVVKAKFLRVSTSSSDLDLVSTVDVFGSEMSACPPTFANFEGNCYRFANHYQTFATGS